MCEFPRGLVSRQVEGGNKEDVLMGALMLPTSTILLDAMSGNQVKRTCSSEDATVKLSGEIGTFMVAALEGFLVFRFLSFLSASSSFEL